jgi:hypothetical protein
MDPENDMVSDGLTFFADSGASDCDACPNQTRGKPHQRPVLTAGQQYQVHITSVTPGAAHLPKIVAKGKVTAPNNPTQSVDQRVNAYLFKRRTNSTRAELIRGTVKATGSDMSHPWTDFQAEFVPPNSGTEFGSGSYLVVAHGLDANGKTKNGTGRKKVDVP